MRKRWDPGGPGCYPELAIMNLQTEKEISSALLGNRKSPPGAFFFPRVPFILSAFLTVLGFSGGPFQPKLDFRDDVKLGVPLDAERWEPQPGDLGATLARAPAAPFPGQEAPKVGTYILVMSWITLITRGYPWR